jgi:hypothetical protein
VPESVGQTAVFGRCFTRLLAVERRVASYAVRYAEREELVGIRLLVHALNLTVADAERAVLAEQRRLGASATGATVRRAERIAKKITRTTEMLVGQRLHFIEREHGRALDPLVAPLVRLARDLSPQTEIIFRPSEPLGYAVSQPLLDEIIETLDDRSSELVWTLRGMPDLVYIRYPAVDEGEVFQHLLMGHELAHLVLRIEKGGQRLGSSLFNTSFSEWKARQGGAPDASDEPYRDLLPRAQSWFGELASDYLALKLMGPGYFMAKSLYVV